MANYNINFLSTLRFRFVVAIADLPFAHLEAEMQEEMQKIAAQICPARLRGHPKD